MSNKLKIKLSVANRVYPLTISPSQEEGLRLAAQQINNLIKKFEQVPSIITLAPNRGSWLLESYM